MTDQPQTNRSKKLAVYIDRLPPCNNACPAGENIQAWLNLVQQGDLRGAWEKLVENNPLPAVHGRVCYHPCEGACNRVRFDSAVSIHNVERYLGDLALQEKWSLPKTAVPPSGKKVLVVGAGPAGLSAAYHLMRLGHSVTLAERDSFLGGLMHSGIPPYRLPRDILDGEIQKIIDFGVNVQRNYAVKSLMAEKKQHGYDAIFLGTGAARDKKAALELDHPVPILGAIEFLHALEVKSLAQVPVRVAIYGGGNTAIDAARSALRLGAREVTIIYRRDRAHMPAFAEEIADAEAEGVRLHVLRTIKSIKNNQFNLEIMQLAADGKPEATGIFEQFTADLLLLALGQDAETGFLNELSEIQRAQDGILSVAENFMTGEAGVFAGGDIITKDRSVTIAVGHGKKAARHIDAYLRDSVYHKPTKAELAKYEYLHLEKAVPSAPVAPTHLSASERAKTFNEIVAGIDAATMTKEAGRCFSCGNCFECDICFNVCPVKAIDKLGKGKRYHIKDATCIGCSLCARKCPCGAIVMKERGIVKSEK